MSDVLRNYIRDILLEAKKTGDEKLLSNQTIGWAAEHAVYVALGGVDQMLSDKRIIKPYSAASPAAKKAFVKIYKKMINAATVTATSSLGSCAGLPPPGAGNRPVDVESDICDIHVKYNDFKRLLGFQKQDDSEDMGESMPPALSPGATQIIDAKEFGSTSSAYDKSLGEFFEKIQNKSNAIYKRLDAESKKYLTGAEKAHVRATHMRKRLGGRKSAKSFGEESPEYIDFLNLRKAYQNALKLIGRDLFYEILDKNQFKEKLLQDIENLIFKSKNKVLVSAGKGKTRPGKVSKNIIFAKFKGPDDGDISEEITCEYYDYSKLLGIGTGPKSARSISEKMVVREFSGNFDIEAATGAAQKNASKKGKSPEVEAEEAGEISEKMAPTTIFYQVVDIEDESKVYFQIEFRLDGDSHPPQLKTGKAIMSL